MVKLKWPNEVVNKRGVDGRTTSLSTEAGYPSLPQSLFISEKLYENWTFTETHRQTQFHRNGPTRHYPMSTNNKFMYIHSPFWQRHLINTKCLCIPPHLHFRPTPPPRPLLNIRAIVERVPTKRASTLVTARKPLEQAAAVKEVLASPTTLIRHLLVAGHDAVADGTLGLALQRAGDVAAEG